MLIVPPAIVPMGNLVSSCVLDLDATIVDSFVSGETWSNIEPIPGDGSATADNDFYMGATGTVDGDEPTLTGTAGDPAAYMLYDGGDQNNFKGTITTFFDSLHKTTGGSDFTVFIPYYFISGTAFILFDTRGAGGATVGNILYNVAGNDRLYFTQRGTTAPVTRFSTGAVTGSGFNIVGISHSHSANNTKFWVNSSTAEDVVHTFNTSTAAASGVPSLGAYSGGTSPAPSGTRYYGASIFNEYFDDAKARIVIDQYNARHNRVYA